MTGRGRQGGVNSDNEPFDRLRVTERAFRVTEGAFRVTEAVLRVTERAFRVTEGAFRVTVALQCVLQAEADAPVGGQAEDVYSYSTGVYAGDLFGIEGCGAFEEEQVLADDA